MSICPVNGIAARSTRLARGGHKNEAAAGTAAAVVGVPAAAAAAAEKHRASKSPRRHRNCRTRHPLIGSNSS